MLEEVIRKILLLSEVWNQLNCTDTTMTTLKRRFQVWSNLSCLYLYFVDDKWAINSLQISDDPFWLMLMMMMMIEIHMHKNHLHRRNNKMSDHHTKAFQCTLCWILTDNLKVDYLSASNAVFHIQYRYSDLFLNYELILSCLVILCDFLVCDWLCIVCIDWFSLSQSHLPHLLWSHTSNSNKHACGFLKLDPTSIT